MEKLNLKPKSKHVVAYYEALEQFKSLKVSHESAVRAAFQNLLEACSRQFKWALVAEWQVKRAGRAAARVDGALVDEYRQPNVALNWRVEKMKLGKDKRSLHYNEFLTLARIPEEAFEYRLGNRSALEWVIDQYRVTTDSRSGITNDPNRADDPSYIVRLVGQVITVSLETVKIVRSLPDLGIEKLQEV